MSNLNSEANENTKKEEDSKTNNPAIQEKEPEKAAAKRSKLDSLFDAPIEEKPKVVVQVKNDINAKNNEKLNKQKQKYMEIKNQTETKKRKEEDDKKKEEERKRIEQEEKANEKRARKIKTEIRGRRKTKKRRTRRTT